MGSLFEQQRTLQFWLGLLMLGVAALVFTRGRFHDLFVLSVLGLALNCLLVGLLVDILIETRICALAANAHRVRGRRQCPLPHRGQGGRTWRRFVCAPGNRGAREDRRDHIAVRTKKGIVDARNGRMVIQGVGSYPLGLRAIRRISRGRQRPFIVGRLARLEPRAAVMLLRQQGLFELRVSADLLLGKWKLRKFFLRIQRHLVAVIRRLRINRLTVG